MKATLPAAWLMTLALASALSPAHGRDASTPIPSVRRPNPSLLRNKVFFWDGKKVDYTTWRAMLRVQYMACRKPKGKR
jgi:hypothetical protein